MSDRLRNAVEGLIIVLGLLSFWPLVLGYQGRWYQCGILLVAILLVIVAVARLRRVRRAFENERERKF
jgi:uncharacterized membrane protein